MTIDTKYYRVVVETQTDPDILKSELMDLIKEIESELLSTPPKPANTADAEPESWFVLDPTKKIPIDKNLADKLRR